MDTGYHVTPVIDRDYSCRSTSARRAGVLFEVATNEPGFNRDEDTAHLGEALKLPSSMRTCERSWRGSSSRSPTDGSGHGD